LSTLSQENTRKPEKKAREQGKAQAASFTLSPLADELRRKYNRDYARERRRRNKASAAESAARNTSYWERRAERVLREYQEGAQLDRETLEIVQALDKDGPEARA